MLKGILAFQVQKNIKNLSKSKSPKISPIASKPHSKKISPIPSKRNLSRASKSKAAAHSSLSTSAVTTQRTLNQSKVLHNPEKLQIQHVEEIQQVAEPQPIEPIQTIHQIKGCNSSRNETPIFSRRKNTKTNIKKIKSSTASFEEPKASNKLQDSFYSTMSNFMSHLSRNCLSRIKAETQEKSIMKKQLERSVQTYRDKITMYNSKKRYWIKENSKLIKEIDQLSNISMRYKLNKTFQEKTPVPSVDQEKINRINRSTHDMEKKIISEKSSVELIKNEIKKYNKMICKVEKEKEALSSEIKITKKHISNLLEKLERRKRDNMELSRKTQELIFEIEYK